MRSKLWSANITVSDHTGYGATMQFEFDRNLAVRLQIWPKICRFFLQRLFINKTQFVIQESITASDFKFPCKPLLGPSSELMQPQPSLRAAQGSITVASARKRSRLKWKWEVLGRKGFSEAVFAPAQEAWHRSAHVTVNYRNYGALRSSEITMIYEITVRPYKRVSYSAQA